MLSRQIENIPYEPNVFFTGREDVLEQIHEALHNKKSAALTQAISGLGGIGKTQTALEYTYRHKNDYSTILWINADSRDRLLSELNAVAVLLDLPERHQPDQALLLNAFKRWLQQNPRWLLILDNADDLDLVQEILPRRTGGHTLITTRSQITGGIAPQRIEIKNMSLLEGALFLLRRAKLLEHDAPIEQASEQKLKLAVAITRHMNGLPLALDQAGAYIDETQCGLDGYLALYQNEKHQRELLGQRGQRVLDHPEPVAITWSISFEKVQQANPSAVDILSLCAFLDPESIPETIFTQAASVLGPPLNTLAEEPLKFNAAITALLNYSLIRRHSDHTLTIHRLVQQVLKFNMDKATQRLWAERAVLAINYLFPSHEYKNWPLCFDLLPQARNGANLITHWQIESAEAGMLLNQIGLFLEKQGEYEEAFNLIECSLLIAKRMLGEEHPDTATSVNNLAGLYERQGRYTGAESLYEQGLEMRKRLLGEEHPDTARSMNNLAGVYARQGRYQEAEPLYKQALEIYRRVLGEEHPDTATSVNNLAGLYERQGRYTEAEPLYRQGLKISKRVLGEEHPDTAASMNNLAGLYASQGRYAEAEPLYRQALEMRGRVLGKEHPDTATSVNDLALLYASQGRYAEAEPLYEQGLEMRRRVLGEEHPDTAASVNNLAVLYVSQGRYQEAEPLYEQGLEISKRVLGEEHPDTAMSVNNLAVLYARQGRYQEAEPLYRQALEIRKRVLGEEHPDTAMSVNDLASLYTRQGRYQEAEPLYRQALDVFVRKLGGEHPTTLTVAGNYFYLLELKKGEQ